MVNKTGLGLSCSRSYGIWLNHYMGNQCTTVVSSNPAHDKVYLIQHYVLKFVSDLQWVGGFLLIFWFPPSIKLTATL